MWRPIVFAGVLLLAATAPAQTLQHRKPGDDGASDTSAASPQPGKSAAPRKALPPAAEGEYRWREVGEVIELYVENGSLQGYLTRRSERSRTGSAPMTFAFVHTEMTGSTLRFTTRHIHGEWYSFVGQVVRGPGKTPAAGGYYLLQGTLETHGDNDAATGGPLTLPVTLKRSAGGS